MRTKLLQRANNNRALEYLLPQAIQQWLPPLRPKHQQLLTPCVFALLTLRTFAH